MLCVCCVHALRAPSGVRHLRAATMTQVESDEAMARRLQQMEVSRFAQDFRAMQTAREVPNVRLPGMMVMCHCILLHARDVRACHGFIPRTGIAFMVYTIVACWCCRRACPSPLVWHGDRVWSCGVCQFPPHR